MKRILIYSVFVFVIPMAVASILLGRINPKIVTEGRLFALEYCDTNKDYNDILFIGSSRVRRHVDPLVIDSVTHLKSFNLSIEAAEAVECNMLLNKYLQHHPRPRILFLSMDLNTFDVDNRQPYINDYFKYLDDTIVNRCISPYRLAYRNVFVRDYYKALKFFSATDMDKNNVLFPGKIKQTFTNLNPATGFAPQENSGDVKVNPKEYFINACSQKGIDVVKDMVGTCRKDSIQVAFLFCPFYRPAKKYVTNYDSIFHVIASLSKQLNVPLFDYSNMAICDSLDYFNNLVHLNARGAAIYSDSLAKDIKNEMLDSTGRYYQRPRVNIKFNNH